MRRADVLRDEIAEARREYAHASLVTSTFPPGSSARAELERETTYWARRLRSAKQELRELGAMV